MTTFVEGVCKMAAMCGASVGRTHRLHALCYVTKKRAKNNYSNFRPGNLDNLQALKSFDLKRW